MSFEIGFQENHAEKLRSLALEIEERRLLGKKSTVNLELLKSTASMAKVIKPAKLLKLIAMATLEVEKGYAVAAFEFCNVCEGAGEYSRYTHNGNEDEIYDEIVSCCFCRGDGAFLSDDLRENMGLFEIKALSEARRACKLTIRDLHRILNPWPYTAYERCSFSF